MSTAAINKCPIPDYLNEELIRKTLRKEFNSEDIVVEEFDVSPATSAGDNYMSDVFRIPVKYRYLLTSKKAVDCLKHAQGDFNCFVGYRRRSRRVNTYLLWSSVSPILVAGARSSMS